MNTMKKFITPALALRSLSAIDVIRTSQNFDTNTEINDPGQVAAPGRQAAPAPAPAANADVNPDHLSN